VDSQRSRTARWTISRQESARMHRPAMIVFDCVMIFDRCVRDVVVLVDEMCECVRFVVMMSAECSLVSDDCM
jgi:hypothetical protein